MPRRPCFGKSQILAIFCQFPVAENVKRHIYTPIPFIWTYSHASRTIRFMFRKTAVLGSFGHYRPFSGTCNPMRSKLPEGTSTRQEFSFSPTPTSLRPSVTKKQPGKVHVSKNRCFWTFWQNSAISGGRIHPKLSKGTSTRKAR